MDLIFRNATLPSGRQGVDIGINDGRIVAVEPSLAAAARNEIDVGGRLASPPFIDPHFHLDTVLSLGFPRVNHSGTLLEGIELWREAEPHNTYEWIVARALQ